MAKPILVVKLPYAFNTKKLEVVHRNLRLKTNKEYHVIILYCQEQNNEINFEVLNSKQHSKIDFEKLKKYIKTLL